jgi:hypothetical protein
MLSRRLVETYNLAVEVVLLHHHDVDTLWVTEGEETKSSRATSSRVAHDSAFTNFAEL